MLTHPCVKELHSPIKIDCFSVIPYEQIDIMGNKSFNIKIECGGEAIYLRRTDVIVLCNTLLQFQYLPDSVQSAEKVVAHDLVVQWHRTESTADKTATTIEFQDSPFTSNVKFGFDGHIGKKLHQLLVSMVNRYANPIAAMIKEQQAKAK